MSNLDEKKIHFWTKRDQICLEKEEKILRIFLRIQNSCLSI